MTNNIGEVFLSLPEYHIVCINKNIVPIHHVIPTLCGHTYFITFTLLLMYKCLTSVCFNEWTAFRLDALFEDFLHMNELLSSSDNLMDRSISRRDHLYLLQPYSPATIFYIGFFHDCVKYKNIGPSLVNNIWPKKNGFHGIDPQHQFPSYKWCIVMQRLNRYWILLTSIHLNWQGNFFTMFCNWHDAYRN